MLRAESLQPILTYDAERSSDLLGTLASYFSCRGNLSQMAKELCVHYNTVVYRMQKIRELTNLDLDDERVLLELQIALYIQRMKACE